MRIRQMKLGPMENFVYLVVGPAGEAVVVDPGWDVAAIQAAAAEEGARITNILVTHGHPDHVNGVAALRAATGARVWAHESADHPVDERLAHGQRVKLAGLDVEALHTPGHRFDAMCFVVEETHVLTGDTLFVGECGRVDLPGSDVDAMHRTLHSTLAALSRWLVVLPGHDYGARPVSTLHEEYRTSYVLKPRTLEEFRAFMAEP